MAYKTKLKPKHYYEVSAGLKDFPRVLLLAERKGYYCGENKIKHELFVAHKNMQCESLTKIGDIIFDTKNKYSYHVDYIITHHFPEPTKKGDVLTQADIQNITDGFNLSYAPAIFMMAGILYEKYRRKHWEWVFEILKTWTIPAITTISSLCGIATFAFYFL